jgi:hypothetical protein
MIGALRDYRPDLPQLVLLAANLLPLFGVLLADWDVGAIVLLYWSENLIIGGYTILKMLVAGRLRALQYVLFFCLHYGGFCAVHGVFVLELAGYSGMPVQTAAPGWPGPLALVEKFVELAARILQAAPEEFLWGCLALLLSHGISFLLLYLGQGEFRRTTPRKLMSAPYQRIVVLHVAIIAGAFLVRAVGSPIGLLLALVALKIVMDIMLHIRAHRDATAKQPGAADMVAGGAAGPVLSEYHRRGGED